MEQEIAQKLFWVVIGLATLCIIQGFIFYFFRKTLFFEIKLWWKKPKGYGIMEIINNDGTREHRIEKLTDEEIRIEGKDSEYERYFTEKTLYTYRLRDKVSVGTWFRNIPYMMNMTGRKRKIMITEGTKSLELPEPFKQEDMERADVIDSTILRHKHLRSDFFSKYWKYIVFIVLIVGLITIIGFYMLHTQQTKILDGCISQTDMIKAICSQRVV